ncbi:CG7567, partial [Drosophila busckii]
MCRKLSLLLLLLGLSLGSTLAFHLQTSLKTSSKIQELQMESKVLAETHQDTSSMCFAYYSPQLSQVTDQYQADYDLCMTNYEHNKTVSVHQYYKNDLEQIETDVYRCSEAMLRCYDAETAIEAFECISTTAAEEAQIFYGVSSNATQVAAEVKLFYVKIDTELNKCVNSAERSYVENTSNVYDQLNACLRSNKIPPTPTPPTPTYSTP